jgi:hypothetical protein
MRSFRETSIDKRGTVVERGGLNEFGAETDVDMLNEMVKADGTEYGKTEKRHGRDG